MTVIKRSGGLIRVRRNGLGAFATGCSLLGSGQVSSGSISSIDRYRFWFDQVLVRSHAIPPRRIDVPH